MSLQLIFISGLPPLRVERPRSWETEHTPNCYRWASSVALICPKCLERWAILKFEEDEEVQPLGGYCERCSPPKRESGWPSIPGSIFSGWFIDLPLLEALPEEMLRREVELHLKENEKWNF